MAYKSGHPCIWVWDTCKQPAFTQTAPHQTKYQEEARVKTSVAAPAITSAAALIVEKVCARYCRLGYLSAKLGITSCSMWRSKTTRVSPAGATSVTCSPHFLLSFSPGLWYRHSLPPLRLSSHPEGKKPHVHLTDTVIHCACLVNVLPL